MNKQEERIINAGRKVLSNWTDGDINANVSGDFAELASALKIYDTPSVMDFDWQSFRNQAAKDILCSMIQGGYAESRIEHQSALAIKYADELIKQLRGKEA